MPMPENTPHTLDCAIIGGGISAAHLALRHARTALRLAEAVSIDAPAEGLPAALADFSDTSTGLETKR